jgi:gephyrin
MAFSIDAHVSTIRRGIENADILLTTGGTSMGPADLLKPVIERHFNGTIHFGRVTIKPGKPTTFATIPFQGPDGEIFKPVFALPGNPASALVTFYIFVLPALRLLGGWPKSSWELPRVRVEVSSRDLFLGSILI